MLARRDHALSRVRLIPPASVEAGIRLQEAVELVGGHAGNEETAYEGNESSLHGISGSA